MCHEETSPRVLRQIDDGTCFYDRLVSSTIYDWPFSCTQACSHEWQTARSCWIGFCDHGNGELAIPRRGSSVVSSSKIYPNNVRYAPCDVLEPVLLPPGYHLYRPIALHAGTIVARRSARLSTTLCLRHERSIHRSSQAQPVELEVMILVLVRPGDVSVTLTPG